ncbi:MAG: hypothetical protein R2851_04445 [Caldilineaceae bacterium]
MALEPEFTMFKPSEDGSYTPADHDGMFTVAWLDRHCDLWERIIALLAEMGVSVDQFGKEYGPAAEGSTHHGDPISAVDDYLTFKEVVKVAARGGLHGDLHAWAVHASARQRSARASEPVESGRQRGSQHRHDRRRRSPRW